MESNSKKRILLLTEPSNADTIGSVPCNREKVKRHVIKENGINVGNKVFITAVEQYLTKPDILYECKAFQTTPPNLIYEQFDMVVAPLANIFNNDSTLFLENLADWVEQCRVPFFLLGCGIGCGTYDEIDILVEKIRPAVCKLMEAIYRGGGEIATRGWKTKEFLDRCMHNTAVATGCPSFYRKGTSLHIEKPDIRREDFAIALNSCDYPQGVLRRVLNDYPNSMLIDQELFISEYFSCEEKGINVLGYEILAKYGWEALEYFAMGKVFPAIDIPTWQKELQKFSFAYGSRIHGTITAIHAGIPMKIVCKGARTREMAEYLGIPRSEKYTPDIDLYEEYMNLDLSEFHWKYKQGFRAFEEFITEHGISYNLDDDSWWREKIRAQSWNQIEIWSNTELGSLNSQMRKKNFIVNYNLYRMCKKLNRKKISEIEVLRR